MSIFRKALAQIDNEYQRYCSGSYGGSEALIAIGSIAGASFRSDSGNDPDYQWRPATMGDIGSVARFGDTEHTHEPWCYGLLVSIDQFGEDELRYMCNNGEETQPYLVAQIQYDANKEPQ